MKKILAIIGVFLLWCFSVFAYTPSTDLVERMDVVVEKFEDIIDIKWERYRTAVLNAVSKYKAQYSDDERITYILGYLYDNLKADDVDMSDISVSSDYTGSYTISDDTYGTEVEVVVSGDTRTITSNALPNHATGDFPTNGNPNTISAQGKSWELTTDPSYTGDATWMRESGVAYNGVKFELETAESVSCASGENYRIEAQQTAFNLWLDYNMAHVQPTGEYHYHGVADLLMDTLEGDDVVHVWYANDGFPIYYSKQGTYTPSYELSSDDRTGTSCTYRDADVTVQGTTPDGTYGSDWEYINGLGNLDSCNGAYINGEYVYFITEGFPFGPRCSNGEISGQSGPWGQGWADGEQRGPLPGENDDRRGPPPTR